MFAIAHFTVVCSVTWPLSGNEAGVESTEVCIKTESTAASLPLKRQVTKQTIGGNGTLSTLLRILAVCRTDPHDGLPGALLLQHPTETHLYWKITVSLHHS